MKTCLRVATKVYDIENNIVTCTIKAKIKYQPKIFQYIRDITKSEPLGIIEATGIAKCYTRYDEFNIELGKDIAESRAMKNAFTQYYKYINSILGHNIRETEELLRRAAALSMAISNEKCFINGLIRG
jgi:hypothetical protein